MNYEKSCGAVCFYQGAGPLNVLVVRHKLGTHWAFPKGHVENEETEYETAIREVLEETGVNITILDGFRHENTYKPAKNITKTVAYFVATSTTTATVPQPEEIKTALFMPLSKARTTLTYTADKQMLEEAVKFYENLQK